MPRQENVRKTNKRTGYESAKPAVSNTAVASPVRVNRAPGQLGQLLESLQSVSPKVSAVLDKYNTEANAEEFKRGALQRETTSGDKVDQELEDIKARNINFQQGYMHQHGRVSALKASEELRRMYEDGSFDRKAGDIDTFTRDFIAQDTKGVNDDAYLDGYLPVIMKEADALREAHFLTTQKEVSEKVRTDAFDWTLAAARDAKKSGTHLTGKQLGEQFRENHDFLQLSYPEQDEILFNVGRQLAQEGDVESMAMFDENKPNGIPAMSKNPKWASKIMELKALAQRVREKEEAEENGKWAWQTYKYHYTEADSGRFDEAKLMEANELGRITDGEMKSIWNHYKKRQVEIARDTSIYNGIAKNDLGTIAQHETQFIQPQFEKWAAQVAQTEQDPAKAVGMVADRAATLGIKHTPWVETLSRANPAHPESFKRGYELYQHVKGTNAVYLEKLVSQADSLKYDLYNTMVTMGGASPEEALETIQLYASKDATTDALDVMRLRDTRDEIDQTLGSLGEGGIKGFFQTTAEDNEPYVRRSIRALMMENMITTNGNSTTALEWAKNRFEATHQIVDGRWLYTGGRVLPGNFKEGAEWFLKEFQEQKAKNKGQYNADGYYIATTARSLNDTRHYAIVEKGSNRIVAGIDGDQMLKEYQAQKDTTERESKRKAVTFKQKLGVTDETNTDEFAN